MSTAPTDNNAAGDTAVDEGQPDPGTGPTSSDRVRISSNDGTGTCTLLDAKPINADKDWEALASNSSSFMLEDGRVRVSSTRRENPLYVSQTSDRDSGAYSITSISEITDQCAESEDYLSWAGDEADDTNDDMITYPHRKFNMRPSNALCGAGPMRTRRSSDDDPHPPAEGARPLLVGDFRGFGFVTRTPGFASLDVSALY